MTVGTLVASVLPATVFEDLAYAELYPTHPVSPRCPRRRR